MAANMVSSYRLSVDRRVVKCMPPTFKEMTSGNCKIEWRQMLNSNYIWQKKQLKHLEPALEFLYIQQYFWFTLLTLTAWCLINVYLSKIANLQMVVLWSFSGSMKRHKLTTQHIQVWRGLHNIGRALRLLDGMFPCPVLHCFNLVCD